MALATQPVRLLMRSTKYLKPLLSLRHVDCVSIKLPEHGTNILQLNGDHIPICGIHLAFMTGLTVLGNCIIHIRPPIDVLNLLECGIPSSMATPIMGILQDPGSYLQVEYDLEKWLVPISPSRT